jgi:hypothetical protein
MVSLEADLSKVVLIEEVVTDDEPLVVVGQRDHVWARVRAEIDDGCLNRSLGIARPGVPPVWDPICVTRNPPSFSGRKSSVMFESVPVVENMNFGRRA